MILRLRFGRWRITFTFAPVVDVIGVNSRLPDGNHIPMWDFDNVRLGTVITELERVQRTYNLPNIYILETKENSNYIAYCFKRLPWRKVVEILAYTRHLDWGYFRFGVYRGYFTLRVSPKCGRTPKLAWIIKSRVPEDVYITDLKSWVKYETLQDGYKGRRIEIAPKRSSHDS